MKLVGAQIDDKLNFSLYISNISKSAVNRLISLIRFNRFWSFKAKRVLVNSYFYSNVNYCPLAWIISSAKSFKNTESLQKKHFFTYVRLWITVRTLLTKSGRVNMKAIRLRTLCVDFDKRLNSINEWLIERFVVNRDLILIFVKSIKLALIIFLAHNDYLL